MTTSKLLQRPMVRALLFLLVLWGLFEAWKEFLEDRLFPKRWGEVEEGLYRSGQLHRDLIEQVLVDNGIEVIVNMNRPAMDKPDHAAEMVVAEELGIENYRFPMLGDGQGDPENYVLALDQVRRSLAQDQKVLVHCTAGSQRTGAAIGLYRVLFQGWSTAEAVEEMASYDFDPIKDADLLRFLDNNMTFLTRRLVETGALEAVPEPLPRFYPG
ncbi:MAG: hypothetical protein AAGE43_04055 [Pseudomonadota bacterium]